MARTKTTLVAALTLATVAIAGCGLTHGEPAATRPVDAGAPATSSTLAPPATASTTIAGDAPTAGTSVPPHPAAAGPVPRETSNPPGPPSTDPGVAAREPISGWGHAPPPSSTEPIGELDDDGPVPAGLGLVAPPAQAGPGSPHGSPTGLAVEPSCSHQCISRGVAYPRGFGAELIVETTVPAQLFLSIVADLDGNGSYEDARFETTPHGVTAHHWSFDHLEPGQTYHVMATATDDDGHTAHVWGEFTTLSRRDVVVAFGDGEVIGGPDSIAATRFFLGLDGPPTNVTPGEGGIPIYPDQPRHIDIDFWMLRSWNGDLCKAWIIDGAPPYGHDTDSCVTWNSTHLDAVDLDAIPAAATHWTQTDVTVVLHPTSDGGGVPPGYGDPYYFTYELPITLVVTYS